MPKYGELIGLVLIHAIRAWKRWREEHPEDATLTDAQAIELLQTDSDRVVEKGQAWLAAHP